MKLRTFLLTVGLATCPAAHAQFGNSLRHELNVFSEVTAEQCSSVKEQSLEFDANSDPLTAFTLKDAVQSLCVCMPAQTEALMKTLTAQDLARSVTEVELKALLKPYAIDKCAAEQMRNMYGDQCHQRFSKADLDVVSYCDCMKKTVSGYSNAVTAAIATAASDYLPLAAEAENKGAPVPQRPPILEAYFQADQACKGKREPVKAAEP
jgi:hypothetical protein